MSTFILVIALRDHVGEVNAIALTDKSLNYLVSASFDKNIKVFSSSFLPPSLSSLENIPIYVMTSSLLIRSLHILI